MAPEVTAEEERFFCERQLYYQTIVVSSGVTFEPASILTHLYHQTQPPTEHQHVLITPSLCRLTGYTDIFMAMALCGSYPFMTKSSSFHPSMLPPLSLVISSSGKARGSLSNCVLSASTWSQ